MSNNETECVLVTGGSGLVGRAIEELIKVEGAHLVSNRKLQFVFLSSKDADLTDKEQTRKLFSRYRPNYVINLAARVGGLYANMNDNESFCHVNTLINENVLYYSNEFNVKKCISSLSTCIFPDKIDYPLDESKIHLGPPHHSNWGYSIAKRKIDILNRQYNQDTKADRLFTAIIPSNVYGAFDNFSLDESHVVPGLIHKAFLSAKDATSKGLKKARLVVCGSGKPMRQFIYAPDLAKLIVWALDKYDDPEPLLLCPDESDEISIKQVATTICKCMGELYGIKMHVENDLDKSDGQFKKTATNGKLRKLYPEFTFTPFEVGINKVVKWFCDNYDVARK